MDDLGRRDAATLRGNTAGSVPSSAVSESRTVTPRAALARRGRIGVALVVAPDATLGATFTATLAATLAAALAATLAATLAVVTVLIATIPSAQASDPFCTGCHTVDRDGVPHHPTEGTVDGRTAAMPRDLPLADGQITCRTCHRGHGPENQPDPGRFNLRLQPPDLCAQCHRGRDGAWDRPHARYGDALHGGTRLADTTTPAPDPSASDPISARCTACHDGGDPEYPAAPMHAGRSHPLAYYAGRDGLRRVEDLPASIRLVDDRLSCVSCHSTYAGTHLLMALPGRKSDTCTACHDFGTRAAASEPQQQ